VPTDNRDTDTGSGVGSNCPDGDTRLGVVIFAPTTRPAELGSDIADGDETTFTDDAAAAAVAVAPASKKWWVAASLGTVRQA
jgi:hypothetical protein